MKITKNITVEMDIDLKSCAEWFANLDDDSQAKFFVEVANFSKEWKGGFGNDHQWWAVGSHLAKCKCSTEEARELIRSIHSGLESTTTP